jgi:hypothetical protein
MGEAPRTRLSIRLSPGDARELVAKVRGLVNARDREEIDPSLEIADETNAREMT